MRTIEFRGSLDRLSNAGANIFRAHVTLKLCLLHQLRGLFPCSTKQQRAPGLVQRVREIANGAEASGVNGGHVAQTQNNDGRQLVERVQDIGKLIGCAEEERPVNAVNNRVVWDVLALKHVHAAVFHVIFGNRAHRRSPRDFANECERGKHHPDFYRKGQVGNHGQRQR